MTSRRVVSLASAKEDLRRLPDRQVLVEDLALLLAPQMIGTAGNQRRVPLVDLAWSYVSEFLPVVAPSAGTSDERGSDGLSLERGGTTTQVEEEDRVEAARLARQAIADAQEFHRLVRRVKDASTAATDLAPALNDLVRLVRRYTAKIDHSKLPKDDVVPGCVSCARVANCFSPVAERAKGHRLCSWCYDHALAEARGESIGRRHFPPIKAVDILHRQSASAAGRWMAQRARRKGAA